MRRAFNQQLLKKLLPEYGAAVAMHDWFSMQITKYKVTCREFVSVGMTANQYYYAKNAMINITDEKLHEICRALYLITGLSYKKFYRSAIQFKRTYNMHHDVGYEQ
tara:strand:+ start:282 stop:599 length:318 start_codon:yes stop_codon:yes gene_type:complete